MSIKMKNKVAPESSSSEESSYDDSEHESVAEESENEEKDDLPKKFDLSQMQKRLEDAPPSSSDEEDSDPEDDDPESEDEDDNDNSLSLPIIIMVIKHDLISGERNNYIVSMFDMLIKIIQLNLILLQI